MKKINNIIFFPNGNTAAFNEDGQIGECQKSWFRISIERIRELGYDLSDCDIQMPDGQYVKLINIDNDFNWTRK